MEPSDHMLSQKNQLDNLKTEIQNNISTNINTLKTQIQELLKIHEQKILTQMLNFSNQQVKNRIQRKKLTIPKTVNTWLTLLSASYIGDGVKNLNDIILLNVWIERWDRYHHAKSALLEKDFNNSIELFL